MRVKKLEHSSSLLFGLNTFGRRIYLRFVISSLSCHIYELILFNDVSG